MAHRRPRSDSTGRRTPRSEDVAPMPGGRELLQARLYGGGRAPGRAMAGTVGSLTRTGGPPTAQPPPRPGVGSRTGRPQPRGVSLVPKLRMSQLASRTAAAQRQQAWRDGTDDSVANHGEGGGSGSERGMSAAHRVLFTPRRPGDGSGASGGATSGAATDRTHGRPRGGSTRRPAGAYGRRVKGHQPPASARARLGASSAASAASGYAHGHNGQAGGPRVTFREGDSVMASDSSAGPAVDEAVGGVGKMSRRALLLRAQHFRSFMDNVRDTPGFDEASIYGDGFVYLKPVDNNVCVGGLCDRLGRRRVPTPMSPAVAALLAATVVCGACDAAASAAAASHVACGAVCDGAAVCLCACVSAVQL